MELVNFVHSLVENLRQENRYGTARAYRSTLSNVIIFCGKDPEISLVFSKEWLSSYQNWLVRNGRCSNTISFYMRMLQSFYHQAVEYGHQAYIPRLFSKVFTGYDPTAKRALSTNIISRISDADLSTHENLAFCRDMFMLSFYLQGIAFVDMAYLRKSDLKNDTISYHRRKSKSYINTPVCSQALEIIHRYEHLTRDTPYLLPIIRISGKDDYLQYQNAIRTHNRRLKRLAIFLDIDINLTSYASRHSWATTAYHAGIATSVISQALGHRTENVTRVYLASFDARVLTDVNKIVLLALQKKDDFRGIKNSNYESVLLSTSNGQILLQT